MIEPFQPAHADYLRDESRRTGTADRIAFPRTEAEVLAALAEARAHKMPITTQGARTGVTGGAVPEGGLVLNLSHMDKILAAGNGETARAARRHARRHPRGRRRPASSSPPTPRNPPPPSAA